MINPLSRVNLVEVVQGAENGAVLKAYVPFARAMMAEESPGDPDPSDHYLLNEVREDNTNANYRQVCALSEGHECCLGWVEVLLEQRSNTNVAEVKLEVHPDHRRQGIGSRLLRAAVAIAEQENRSSIVPWGLRSDATLGFWETMGLPEVQVDRMSRVAIADVDTDLMQRWRDQSTARANGYRLQRWVGVCPPELMDAYVLTQQGMADAPNDDLQMAPPAMDEAWNRAREKSWADRGGEIRVIVALDPNGRPAGMTEIGVLENRPWFIMQQGTTTLTDFRNQGIGRWLKAEMFQWIVDDLPEATVIETGNADSNAAMLSINTEMGFRKHIALTTRQAPREQVQAALVRRGVDAP